MSNNLPIEMLSGPFVAYYFLPLTNEIRSQNPVRKPIKYEFVDDIEKLLARQPDCSNTRQATAKRENANAKCRISKVRKKNPKNKKRRPRNAFILYRSAVQ
jgi:hypothetical protein